MGSCSIDFDIDIPQHAIELVTHLLLITIILLQWRTGKCVFILTLSEWVLKEFKDGFPQVDEVPKLVPIP